MSYSKEDVLNVVKKHQEELNNCDVENTEVKTFISNFVEFYNQYKDAESKLQQLVQKHVDETGNNDLCEFMWNYYMRG